MEHKLIFQLECPKCNLPVNASIQKSFRGFLLFVCPDCQSNVVFYDNKLDVISDRLLKKLAVEKKLVYCGVLEVEEEITDFRSSPISSDDIIDLRILLGTSDDSQDFIDKI